MNNIIHDRGDISLGTISEEEIDRAMENTWDKTGITQEVIIEIEAHTIATQQIAIISVLANTTHTHIITLEDNTLIIIKEEKMITTTSEEVVKVVNCEMKIKETIDRLNITDLKIEKTIDQYQEVIKLEINRTEEVHDHQRL